MTTPTCHHWPDQTDPSVCWVCGEPVVQLRMTSVRRLPSGSYIVSALGSRSAVTGRFKVREA